MVNVCLSCLYSNKFLILFENLEAKTCTHIIIYLLTYSNERQKVHTYPMVMQKSTPENRALFLKMYGDSKIIYLIF